MWHLRRWSWHLTRRALGDSHRAGIVLFSDTRQGSRREWFYPHLNHRADGHRTISTTATGSDSASRKSRAYPAEPRVGVGVVVFRTPPVHGQDPEVLLVRRTKEPDKGRWCFPGGSLELGETLAACASREVEEEAGLRLRGPAYGAASCADAAAALPAGKPLACSGQGAAAALPASPLELSGPTAFAAVDVMSRDSDGRIRYHYAVVEVAAVSADHNAVPVPGDDADGVQWVPVSRLKGMPDLIVRCDEMAEEAVRRFAVAPATTMPPTTSSPSASA